MRFFKGIGVVVLSLTVLAGCGIADGREPADPTGPASVDTSHGHPLLSPDGAQVAFSSREAGGFSRLQVMRIDGSEYSVLYRDSNEIVPLEWSSDGRHILAVIPGPGNAENAFLISLEGILKRLVWDEQMKPESRVVPAFTRQPAEN